MASTAEGLIQVYFDRGAGLNESDSSMAGISRGPALREYRMNIPAGNYRGFRLDPINCPAELIIEEIFVADSGHRIRTIPLQALKAANEIQSIRQEGSTLTIRTAPEARDPQLAIGLEPPLEVHRTLVGWLKARSLKLIALAGCGALGIISFLPSARRAFDAWATRVDAKEAGSRGSRVGAADVASLLIVGLMEAVAFVKLGLAQYVDVYPRWNDQIQYLGDAYKAFVMAHETGWYAALKTSLFGGTAQGCLHVPMALLAFTIGGPTRSSALSVNMALMVAFQCALFFSTANVFKSRALAWIAFILPISIVGPWSGLAGSAADFRLDLFALCIMGIAFSVGLGTRLFESRPRSILFGVMVAIAIAVRFLTTVYFVLLFFGLLAAIVVAATSKRRRVVNLFLAAGTCAIIAAPFLWVNRASILDYYWSGHYVGPESGIRNQHYGFVESCAFLVRHLMSDHLGPYWLWMGLCMVCVCALAVLLHKGERRTVAESPVRISLLFAGMFLLSPFIVLAVHQQKSAVVVGALVPGSIGCVIVLLALLFEHCQRVVRGMIAGWAMSAGALVFLCQIWATVDSNDTKRTSDRVNVLADYIYQKSAALNLRAPHIGVDYITDCLDAQVMRVICYERHRQWVDYKLIFPRAITEPTPEDIRWGLERSEFVFVTDGGEIRWPYDKGMRQFKPWVREWCSSNLRKVAELRLDGREVTLFERPH